MDLGRGAYGLNLYRRPYVALAQAREVCRRLIESLVSVGESTSSSLIEDMERDNELPSRVPNIIFFTDNGHGLGHLTRMMAVAKHAAGRFNPVFLTMSLGFPLLRDAGLCVEYFPSYTTLGISRRRWDPLLYSRLTELVQSTDARAVVVDHVNPALSFGWLRERKPEVDFVWSRRGLWKEGRNRDGIERAAEFDLVIEPGDLAGPVDRGLTADYRRGAVSIPPVVLVEPADLISREEARAALEIPQSATAVLIQLTDSDPATLESMIRQTHAVLTDVVGADELFCFSPLHPLHKGQISTVEGVEMRPIYPVARYLNGFDGVVSTAGYNSFHEVAVSGVPAVFVPRSTNSIDDQGLRARFAELCGRAFWSPSVDNGRLPAAVRRMLDPGEGLIAADTARRLGSTNGAAQFATILADRARRSGAKLDRPRPGPTSNPPGRRWTYAYLKGEAEVVLIDALGMTDVQLRSQINSEGCFHGVRPDALPVVMAHEANADLLTSVGIPFETVMSELDWERICPGRPYSAYLTARFESGVDRYGASSILELAD